MREALTAVFGDHAAKGLTSRLTEVAGRTLPSKDALQAFDAAVDGYAASVGCGPATAFVIADIGSEAFEVIAADPKDLRPPFTL
jgi:hypothetical protein